MTNLPIDFPCMILAAGRGERMRPLTDHLPKPLLEIHGQSLLEHHLHRLKAVGFTHVVIIHAWLGHLIEARLGGGQKLGLDIQYSAEADALETAGGISTAMPLLNPDDYFFVINGDVYAPDFPFHELARITSELRAKIKQGRKILAYLFLVKNPKHHPQGDFYLKQDQISAESSNTTETKYTFSGAGLYHKDLFKDISTGTRAALAPLLKTAMSQNLIEGTLLQCDWHDVGTPERLAQLNQS